MIVESVLDLTLGDVFLRLKDFQRSLDVCLKIEGLNLAGSIKLKPARAMIEDFEDRGVISPHSHRIIESSSGSLGIALSLVCRKKGYEFTCVTDANVPAVSEELMKAYGSEVIVIRERDEQGGYLGSRLRYIADRLSSDRSYFWPNQYANPSNPLSHYRFTAKEIHSAFPHLDFLFIGAGTTGTLVGCARYFAERSPNTKIIGVDTEGSVTFGGPPGPRWIPGLGTSQRPKIASSFNVADLLLISESRTVQSCHRLLDRFGLLAGASTGTVLAAVEDYGNRIPVGSTVVAVSADFGERYLGTVYDAAWAALHVGRAPSDTRHQRAVPHLVGPMERQS